MTLTAAEKQARYRQRRKETESGKAAMEEVRVRKRQQGDGLKKNILKWKKYRKNEKERFRLDRMKNKNIQLPPSSSQNQCEETPQFTITKVLRLWERL